jgi:probable HAF family extracellular repeat protein
MNLKGLRLFLVLALLTAIPCAAAGPFVFTSIDYPQAIGTNAYGVNASGQIVGVYASADYREHGFLLTGTTFKRVDYPNASRANAYGINSLGQIVGIWSTVGQLIHGFLYNGTSYKTVDVPRTLPFLSSGTQAWGINAGGVIVGQYRTFLQPSIDRGFLLSGGTYTRIDAGKGATFPHAINDLGQIVGSYTVAGVTVGFLRDATGKFTTITHPGATSTSAYGINTLGDIVGSYTTSDGVEHGFLLSGGVFTSIDYPAALYSGARGIDDLGQIVGFYGTDTTERGFLAKPETTASQ